MQTFLPSTLYRQSAEWLDMARLGRQRVECYQILKAIIDPSYGWQNHPAVNMWREHEHSLKIYATAICDEWKRRGYKDTCQGKINELFANKNWLWGDKPPWLTEEFASSHRSILLGKVYEGLFSLADKGLANDEPKVMRQYRKYCKILEWYDALGWTEEPAQRDENGKWPYLWPVTNETD
jgi:hypothetical protein